MAESGNGPGASGDRRGFLVWLTRGFLGLWAVGGGAAIAAYMRPPERHDTSSENVVRVGLLGDYRIGAGRMVRHGVTPFFVIRLDATGVVFPSPLAPAGPTGGGSARGNSSSEDERRTRHRGPFVRRPPARRARAAPRPLRALLV